MVPKIKALLSRLHFHNDRTANQTQSWTDRIYPALGRTHAEVETRAKLLRYLLSEKGMHFV